MRREPIGDNLMSHDNWSSDEFERACSALADGVLTPEEQARLEAVLLVDPAKRELFCRFIEDDYLLAWELNCQSDTCLIGIPAAARACDSPTSPGRLRERLGWTRWAGAMLAACLATIAAAVFLGLPVGSPLGGENQFIADAPAAILSASDKAEWEDGAGPSTDGSLPSGPLRLARGIAQITFSSGAIVAARGPAEFEILNGSRLFVRSGSVTPFVPERARGFTVVAPSGEVVDLGTEFDIAVDQDGHASVFVIDGEVDVRRQHGAQRSPLRLTQGFATLVSWSPELSRLTQRPFVVEHFQKDDATLQRRDVDPGHASFVRDGMLWIPIDGSPNRDDPIVRTILDYDFSRLVGRKSIISFKAMLPDLGSASIERWVALVIDAGDGEPPKATKPAAELAVLLSPEWQAGVRIRGKFVFANAVFSRSDETAGPYQVVITIDDSPQSRDHEGNATCSVLINGQEFCRERRIALGDSPRLNFQTFLRSDRGGTGYALMDDVSVSTEVDNDVSSGGVSSGTSFSSDISSTTFPATLF